jgi:hypothetical protein
MQLTTNVGGDEQDQIKIPWQGGEEEKKTRSRSHAVTSSFGFA